MYPTIRTLLAISLLFIPLLISEAEMNTDETDMAGVNTAGVNINEWLISAQNYAEANAYLNFYRDKNYIEFVNLKNSQIEYIDNKVKGIENSFKGINQPSVYELEKLLDSKRLIDKQIACSAIYLSGIHSDNIINELVENIDSSKPFELKYHCINALDKISQINVEGVAKYGNSILKKVRNEEDDKFLIKKLIILYRVGYDSKNGKKLLTQLLFNAESINEDNYYAQIGAYTLLKRIDPNSANKSLQKLTESIQDDDYNLMKSKQIPLNVESYIDLFDLTMSEQKAPPQSCSDFINKWFDNLEENP